MDSVYNTGGSAITAAIDNYSFFAQDIWKTSPRLTLTYGLRWEINPDTLRHSWETTLCGHRNFCSAPFGIAPRYPTRTHG